MIASALSLSPFSRGFFSLVFPLALPFLFPPFPLHRANTSLLLFLALIQRTSAIPPIQGVNLFLFSPFLFFFPSALVFRKIVNLSFFPRLLSRAGIYPFFFLFCPLTLHKVPTPEFFSFFATFLKKGSDLRFPTFSRNPTDVHRPWFTFLWSFFFPPISVDSRLNSPTSFCSFLRGLVFKSPPFLVFLFWCFLRRSLLDQPFPVRFLVVQN